MASSLKLISVESGRLMFLLNVEALSCFLGSCSDYKMVFSYLHIGRINFVVQCKLITSL